MLAACGNNHTPVLALDSADSPTRPLEMIEARKGNLQDKIVDYWI
jgi:hypothetical protein